MGVSECTSSGRSVFFIDAYFSMESGAGAGADAYKKSYVVGSHTG